MVKQIGSMVECLAGNFTGKIVTAKFNRWSFTRKIDMGNII